MKTSLAGRKDWSMDGYSYGPIFLLDWVLGWGTVPESWRLCIMCFPWNTAFSEGGSKAVWEIGLQGWSLLRMSLEEELCLCVFMISFGFQEGGVYMMVRMEVVLMNMIDVLDLIRDEVENNRLDFDCTVRIFRATSFRCS